MRYSTAFVKCKRFAMSHFKLYTILAVTMVIFFSDNNLVEGSIWKSTNAVGFFLEQKWYGSAATTTMDCLEKGIRGRESHLLCKVSGNVTYGIYVYRDNDLVVHCFRNACQSDIFGYHGNFTLGVVIITIKAFEHEKDETRWKCIDRLNGTGNATEENSCMKAGIKERLKLSSTTRFPQLGSMVDLNCETEGIIADDVSEYTVMFFMLDMADKPHTYGIFYQSKLECSIVQQVEVRYRLTCGPGTNDVKVSKKVYILNILHLQLADFRLGGGRWQCCIGLCKTLVASYQITPIHLSLRITAKTYYLTPGSAATLVCTKSHARHNTTGHLVFVRGTSVVGQLHQYVSGCSLVFDATGYEAQCRHGTSNPAATIQEYALVVEAMAARDYTQWFCRQNTFHVVSEKLDLTQKYCHLQCVKGGTLQLINDTCRCQCPPTRTGDLCEQCNVACKFGTVDDATCQCQCRVYSSGVLCDQCNLTQCHNNGTPNMEHCLCECPNNWDGDLCENCSSTCVNGVYQRALCRCQCFDSWAGPVCDECNVTCTHGRVRADICACRCPPNWIGIKCDKCMISDCNNNGTLRNDTCACSCVGGWTGQRCDDCGIFCDNGGTRRPELCDCVCPRYWTGPTCDKCSIVKCDNGGTTRNDTCTCACTNSWSGPTCDRCDLKCEHDGFFENKDCRCICQGNWDGSSCEECDLSCENEGYLQEYYCRCLCKGNWMGVKCEICSLSCRHGGILLEDTCKCECYGNWTGDTCEEMLSIAGVRAYPRMNSAAQLACTVYGLNSVHMTRRIRFATLHSSGRVTQFAEIKQRDGKCTQVSAVAGYYTYCGRGTTHTHSYTKVYVLTVQQLQEEDVVARWICCTETCKSRSNTISIEPYKLALVMSPPAQVIPLRVKVKLVCIVAYAEMLTARVDFYMGSALSGSAVQMDHECIARFKEEGYMYNTECGQGTDDVMSTLKRYLLIIPSMDEQNYRPWFCELQNFNIKSPILNLQDRLCRLKCVYGTLHTQHCQCVCRQYSSGDLCEICSLDSCRHGGELHNDSCSCACPDYWSGDECGTCDLKCHFGTLEPDACSCDCRPYTSGVQCEKCDVPCQNHGIVEYDSCTCSCADRWTGELCDRCRYRCNHGNVQQSDCSCKCTDFWEGEKCDKCSLKCENEGVRLHSCKCQCKDQWKGPKCDRCNIKCVNGGILLTGSCQACVCPEPWAGLDCAQCSLVCEHGEIRQKTCACQCDEDWYGKTCDIQKARSAVAGSSGLSGGTVVAIVVVALVAIAIPTAWIVYKRGQNKAEPGCDQKAALNKEVGTAGESNCLTVGDDSPAGERKTFDIYDSSGSE